MIGATQNNLLVDSANEVILPKVYCVMFEGMFALCGTNWILGYFSWRPGEAKKIVPPDIAVNDRFTLISE